MERDGGMCHAMPRPDCWMRETRVKLLFGLSDWGWERPYPDHVGILDSIPSWDSEHSVTTKACFLLGSKQKQELLSSSDPIKWQSVSRKYWQTFWHFISHIFRHVYLPFYLSFYPAFYLTYIYIPYDSIITLYSYTIYLTFIPTFDATFFWHSIWHVIWPFIWHISPTLVTPPSLIPK